MMPGENEITLIIGLLFLWIFLRDKDEWDDDE